MLKDIVKHHRPLFTRALLALGLGAFPLVACGHAGNPEPTGHATQAEGFWASDCVGSTPQVSSTAGPVIPNAQVVMVLWQIPNATFNSTVTSQLPSLYWTLTSDFTWLSEYSSLGQQVLGGPGTFMGPYPITPALQGAGISDGAIAAELSRQVANGAIPAPSPSTLYVVHLPQQVQAYVGAPGQEATCGANCGFHEAATIGNSTYYFTVEPDMGSPQCQSFCVNGGVLAHMQTYVASHELIEAITDPGGLASPTWVNSNACTNDAGQTVQGEVCDVCEGSPTFLQNQDYVVASFWSRRERSCVGPGLSSPSVGNPATNVVLTKATDGAGDLRTYNDISYTYLPAGGGSTDVMEINQYTAQTTDLTATMGAATATPGNTSVAAFLDSSGNNDRVYRGDDNHLQFLSRPNGSSAWPSSGYTDITAFFQGRGNYMDNTGIVSAYRRSDGVNAIVARGIGAHANDILEFSVVFSPGLVTWSQNDLSQLSGAAPAAGDPYGFIRSDAVNAVVYVGTDGDIHEIRLPPGGGWSHSDISGPLASPVAGALQAYVRSDQTSAIVFRGNDANIYELGMAGCSNGLPCPAESWGLTNLSAIAGAPPAATDPNGSIDPYAMDSVIYFATSGDVIQLGFLNGQIDPWTYWDADSFVVGSENNGSIPPPPAPGTTVTGGTVNGTARFAYLSTSNDLIEMWYGPAWSNAFWNDVTINGIASGF